jgi:hypothetical protein
LIRTRRVASALIDDRKPFDLLFTDVINLSLRKQRPQSMAHKFDQSN